MMKAFFLGVFVTIVIMVPIISYIGNERCPVTVDLPEEFRSITTHEESPDTVTVFLLRDTLHLNFIQ